MSGLILKANYNDQQKVQWDNAFEAKLGFTTAPSDKEHKYRTNADMLRLTSKLLLKAIRSWNYSFQVTSQTQSLRTYQANSTIYTSAFLAPLDTKVSIGMDYKKSWKNFNISINISPLTYRWLYIGERGDIIGDKSINDGKGNVTLDEFCKNALSQGLEYHQSSGRGLIPAGLIEEIRSLAMPPIPWDVALAKWFDIYFAPLEKHRTYSRPSRRQASTPDIPRPRYTPADIPTDSRTFGVVIDTSGSMDAKTIGKALKMSKKTVMKYVKSLEDKCLITTEHTTVTLKSGQKQNGKLRYTIRPIKEAREHFYRRQMMKLEFNLRNKNKVFLDEKNQAV